MIGDILQSHYAIGPMVYVGSSMFKPLHIGRLSGKARFSGRVSVTGKVGERVSLVVRSGGVGLVGGYLCEVTMSSSASTYSTSGES